MAKLEITISEIVEVLVEKLIIPNYISDIYIDGNRVTFDVKKGLKFRIALEFREFERGVLKFNIISKSLLSKFMKKLVKVDDEYVQLNFPVISIDLQKYFDKQLHITKLENVHFDNGKIIIETMNVG